MNNENNNTLNYIQEDEIDLRELLKTIKNNIFKIALFSFIVTVLTIIYTLAQPNMYKSSIKLLPQQQDSGSSKLAGLGGLAALAGVNIGGSGSDIAIDEHMNIVLADYSFNAYMIEKYNLIEKMKIDENNLVFALGMSLFYDLFHSDKDENNYENKDEQQYNFTKQIVGIIKIEADAKSGVVEMSAELEDRFLAKELVEIYLTELTEYIRKKDMLESKEQLKYYRQELESTYDVALKEQLGSLVSGLIQKEVLAKSSKYYLLKPITEAKVPYIKDKTKPKRALIVIVSFVTSIILGIFGVFFLEFIKNEREESLIEA